MATKKSSHWGNQTHRFKDNSEEERFANAWRDQNEQGHTLAHLLDDRTFRDGHPPERSRTECAVAATVIQWLGSPVGQSFLSDLGYEKHPTIPALTALHRKEIEVLQKLALEGWEHALKNQEAVRAAALKAIERLRRG